MTDAKLLTLISSVEEAQAATPTDWAFPTNEEIEALESLTAATPILAAALKERLGSTGCELRKRNEQ